MTTRSHIEDGESEAFGDVSPSPVARRAGQTSNVIPFRKATSAAFVGFEDEEADCWESVGLLAVRMVGQWSLPFLHVEMSATEGPEVEEETPR